MYEKILVALEGKASDDVAISHAIKLALQHSAELTLLEVVTIASDDAGLRHLQLEPGARGWHRRNRATADLSARKRELQPNGLTVQTALIVGERTEADEIADFAERENFELIVMAADGRPWWQRAILGCIADGVHHKASVPTLFVSDGSRREKIAAVQHPITNNAILDSFGTVCVC